MIPWARLVAVIAPHYSKAAKGRRPVGLERLLRNLCGDWEPVGREAHAVEGGTIVDATIIATTGSTKDAAQPRPYPSRLPHPEYPGHYLLKKVTTGGTFRFQHKLLYIANSLVDQQIGPEETDDGVWSIYFNTVLIATLDERDYIIRG